jgi:hypothetical protein
MQSIGADKVQECSINYFTHDADVFARRMRPLQG